MNIYIILLIVAWVLMGLQAVSPYISSGACRSWWIVPVFVALGPVIAIGNVVNLILLFFGGEDDDSG